MVSQKYRWDFIGLSTDEKPTSETSDKVVNGSTYYCSDISKLYVYCDGTWYERKPLGSGGGGGTSDFNDLSNRPKYNSSEMSGSTNIPEVVTYSDFTGTDGTTAGEAGLVPAPATTDAGKFLSASGLWEEVAGGGGGVTELTSADYNWPTNNPDGVAAWNLTDGYYKSASAVKIYASSTRPLSTSASKKILISSTSSAKTIYSFGGNGNMEATVTVIDNGSETSHYTYKNPNILQTTGSSTTDVMSQNAVTSMVYADPSTKEKILIGSNASSSSYRTVAIGPGSKATSSRCVAIGDSAEAGVTNSVAIGPGAKADATGEFNIGCYNLSGIGYNSSNYRLLTGVYDPQSAHDAATKGYVDAITLTNAGAPTTATVGTVGQLLEDTTNGKLYICTAVTPGTDPDPDTYTWVEVGAGGGGTGAVVELTTDDYDYTYGSTSGVALWRLEAGLYHTANDVQAFAGSGSNDFKLSLKSHLIIIDDDGNRKLIKVVGDNFSTSSAGVYKGFVQYQVAASDGSGSLAQSESVISTASLMRKIGSTPTSSDIGFKGQLWYDSANNKLYINVNAPSDYAGNWKEISLAS